MRASKITKDSVTVAWRKPISNGGSHITAYIVEQSEGEDKWKLLTKSKEITYALEGLVEGQEYCFRVKAQNESGEGPPNELTVVVKDQFGKAQYLARDPA